MFVTTQSYLHTHTHAHTHPPTHTHTHTHTHTQGAWYKKGETPLMALEVRLMAVEIIYLWRALPFCSQSTKQQLLDTLNIALPPGATPLHVALRAWLKGALLNTMGQAAEAETVSVYNHG